jgi:hypothetical protein
MKLKTTIALLSLSFTFALTACNTTTPPPAVTPVPAASAPTAPATIAPAATSIPAAPTTTAAVAPVKADPYPNGMAKTWAQCSQPGYNTNNGLCQPTGSIVPAVTKPDAPNDKQAQLDTMNAMLTKMGDLEALDVDQEGYPILSLECEANGKCINSGGMVLGTVAEVAKEMPPVKSADIIAHDIKCDVICKNSDGQIIGRSPVASN